MESDDEVVERQKLVETEEEPTSQVTTAPQSAPKSAPTPASPVAIQKLSVKNVNSSETTQSRNSGTCSIDRNVSEKGNTTARLSYVNERKNKPYYLHGAGVSDERFEFKPRPRKLLKDDRNVGDTEDNNNQSEEKFAKTKKSVVRKNSAYLGSEASSSALPTISTLVTSNTKQIHNDDSFDERPIKHHSFVSEVPDVKHMERALLGLLDDFHSGKLKAFGFGCTMEQMTKIREQQESLAKLHFELAAAEENLLEHGKDINGKAQEHMLQLVQRLEQLSVSIEQLQANNNSL